MTFIRLVDVSFEYILLSYNLVPPLNFIPKFSQLTDKFNVESLFILYSVVLLKTDIDNSPWLLLTISSNAEILSVNIVRYLNNDNAFKFESLNELNIVLSVCP
jgi:hypothetical protein